MFLANHSVVVNLWGAGVNVLLGGFPTPVLPPGHLGFLVEWQALHLQVWGQGHMGESWA